MRVREIIGADAFDRYGVNEIWPGSSVRYDEDIDSHIRRYVLPSPNWVGSVAMGEDANTSALTPELKLRGVKGLRVVDASSIPVVPSGNIQATVVALADIASDIILAPIFQ